MRVLRNFSFVVMVISFGFSLQDQPTAATRDRCEAPTAAVAEDETALTDICDTPVCNDCQIGPCFLNDAPIGDEQEACNNLCQALNCADEGELSSQQTQCPNTSQAPGTCDWTCSCPDAQGGGR